MALTRAEALILLTEQLVRFRHDPLGFVLWAFPWGVPGGPLADAEGPDEWQREELDEVGRRLRSMKRTGNWRPIRMATASGNGIGKSAEVSWLILWAMMTAPWTKGVVTANTDTQLKTKTWAEVAKWFAMLPPLLKLLFSYTATSLYRTHKNPEEEKRYKFDAIPNSKTNPAAFSGLHNRGLRLLLAFDEASEIDDVIWDMAEGAMTDKDTEIIWIVYGNTTMATGRFKEVVAGRLRHLWSHQQIDSRTVKQTNKEELQSWVDAFGPDSDFVRTHVTGQFPRAGSMQLISSEDIVNAKDREGRHNPSDPFVAGLDVAAYGDDKSVLQPRRGRDAKSFDALEWRGVGPMQLASEVVTWFLANQPDALFIDVGGVGIGVYDRVVQLLGQDARRVYPVDFGGRGGVADFNGVTVKVANKRASMWTKMREWLRLGAISASQDLGNDLEGVQYSYNGDNEILLEPKATMKRRGLASPDNGDALALTFAEDIAPRAVDGSLIPQSGLQTREYDPFAGV